MNHHNFDYNTEASPYPLAVGDRYYTQDLARDYWSNIHSMTTLFTSQYADYPIIIDSPDITMGSDYQKIDIAAHSGICNYEITIPDEYVGLPPTVMQEDIKVFAYNPAISDYDLTTSATLDGSSINYIKKRYAESDGNTRARAKKGGSYVYEKTPSYEIIVNTTAPTDYDIFMGTLVGDGSTFLTIYNNSRSAYKYTEKPIENQYDFNNAIERTAANQYKIKDSITSLKINALDGGYKFYGITSFLSGGDTYAVLSTNNCKKIICEEGTIFDIGLYPSYLNINTEGCKIENLTIMGDDEPTTQIIYNQAIYIGDYANIKLYNCKVQDIVSDADWYVINASGMSDANRITMEMNGCIVENCGNWAYYNYDTVGYYYCWNLTECIVNNPYDKYTGVNHYYGFRYCMHLYRCKFLNDNTNYVDHSDNEIGFYNCEVLNACVYNMTEQTRNPYGFTQCIGVSGCYAYLIGQVSGRGFYSCDGVAGCYGHVIKTYASTSGYTHSVYNGCHGVSGCVAYGESTDGIVAYAGCDAISGCWIGSLTSSSTTNDAIGYDGCEGISGCYAGNISQTGGGTGVARGFTDCLYGAAIDSSITTGNTGNDYIDSVDPQISNKVSTLSIWD